MPLAIRQTILYVSVCIRVAMGMEWEWKSGFPCGDPYGDPHKNPVGMGWEW